MGAHNRSIWSTEYLQLVYCYFYAEKCDHSLIENLNKIVKMGSHFERKYLQQIIGFLTDPYLFNIRRKRIIIF
jgi:hypothetical protein